MPKERPQRRTPTSYLPPVFLSEKVVRENLLKLLHERQGDNLLQAFYRVVDKKVFNVLGFGQVGERNIDAIHTRNLRPLPEGVIISNEERASYEELFNADQQQAQVIANACKIRTQLQATGEKLLEGIHIRDQKAKKERELEDIKKREAELQGRSLEPQQQQPTHWELEARRLAAELEDFKRASLQPRQEISVNQVVAVPSTSSKDPAPLPVLPVSPTSRPAPSTPVAVNLNPVVSIKKLHPAQIAAKEFFEKQKKAEEQKKVDKPAIGRGKSRSREGIKLAATQKRLEKLGLGDLPETPTAPAVTAELVPMQLDDQELMNEILLLQHQ